jgi:NagD protein
MEHNRWAKSWLCDMDGVLIRDGAMVKGADKFLERLRVTSRSFLILTNNSLYTPRDLRLRLMKMGLEVREDQLWTSALATAQFVHWQRPKGTAFVIGEDSLHSAVAEVGYRETTEQPDYVILGETHHYSFEDIAMAEKLIKKGSHFVATNPEPTGPKPEMEETLTSCGDVAALIERATGVAAYFIGKPNPIMMREGLARLGATSERTVMIGDRMDTDVLGGMESGLETILVLSGVTDHDDVNHFPYRPSRIINSVADLLEELDGPAKRLPIPKNRTEVLRLLKRPARH